MVLARRQEQLWAAVLIHLQPQAGAVRVRQLAHRREDERLQAFYVLLGRKGNADPVQLAKLAVAAMRFGLQLRQLLLEDNVFHPDTDELAHGRRGRVGRQLDRHQIKLLWRLLAGG